MSHESQSESTDQSRVEFLTRLVKAVNGERGLFWLLLAIAGYMFVTAAQFPPAAQLFPRLTAGTVLLAGALRLIANYFDIDIQRSENGVLSGDSHDQETEEIVNIDTMIVLAILITGYIIGGYFVGLFWVTPLFVLGYMAYTGQSWVRTLLVTVLMTGVAYGFMTIMNLDLMTGVL